VLVSAASSLSDVLHDVAAAYELETGERVAVNLAASNTLARQIAAGAPVDVFISADQVQMEVVRQALEPGTWVNLLRNQLAVAVAAGVDRELSSLADLRDPAYRRIAIGDPAAVPAGVYARQQLERLGLWDALVPKLVPTGSVRLALAALEIGAVDAALVYRTDIAVARRARAALVIPVGEGPAIVYPVGVVKRGRNPRGARRFLAFLVGPVATEIFSRAGFLQSTP
jgi:molybdate transport system substrate-binding protein